MTELRRARLLVAYHGAAFHGFAPNPGVSTVSGTLTEVLELVCRHPVHIVGAGRTDRGVHAWGQVVSCDLPANDDLAGVQRRINSMCSPSLVVRDIGWADTADFHARYDAAWRHYRYTILNTPVPSPFLAATTWHVAHPLDLRLMQLACDPLIGTHDFTSFCRRPRVDLGHHERSLERRVLLARWTDLGDGLLRFDVRATAFCHQMVRSITGALVDVGLGRGKAGEMAGIMRAKDRNQAGQVAPPQGLCLWEVAYSA